MKGSSARGDDLFLHNAYVRIPNESRRAEEKSGYKKGWEVRLIAGSEAEAEALRQAAMDRGYRPGKVFAKSNQFVVPIYGREAVERFVEARGKPTEPVPNEHESGVAPDRSTGGR